MASARGHVPFGEVIPEPAVARGLRSRGGQHGVPGTFSERADVRVPEAYAVFDCETTGTDASVDEIVSLAVVRLDGRGVETVRFASLVRPSCPIPMEATAVHGIGNCDVADAPTFAELAPRLLELLGGSVFVAHNAPFDLGMLHHAFERAGLVFHPDSVACTLEAFRLVDPLAPNHRLESICEQHGIALEGAHEALGDVLATVALLRVLLERGIAPETVQLDHVAYMRLRSRGDRRPASAPQVQRVFGLARAAGLVHPDGSVDRDAVVALVERVSGMADVDALTREQVQDVYDELDLLVALRPDAQRAASA
jgi:DNA polymerase III epsilon subunit family exonuclease